MARILPTNHRRAVKQNQIKRVITFDTQLKTTQCKSFDLKDMIGQGNDLGFGSRQTGEKHFNFKAKRIRSETFPRKRESYKNSHTFVSAPIGGL